MSASQPGARVGERVEKSLGCDSVAVIEVAECCVGALRKWHANEISIAHIIIDALSTFGPHMRK